MAGSAGIVIRDLQHFGRGFWLPPGGWGNGLDDDSWATILDVRGEHIASLLLMTLGQAGVPAYAAVLHHRPGSRSRGPESGGPEVRIWVGSAHYGAAETTILQAMPGLLKRYGSTIIG